MLIIHGKHDNIKAAELKLFFKGALNMHEGHDHHHHSHEEGFETIEQAVALINRVVDEFSGFGFGVEIVVYEDDGSCVDVELVAAEVKASEVV